MVKSPDKGLPATTPMGTSVFLASTDMSARSGLVQCRDAVAWDAFHKSSPHGTPFVLDWYLNNVCPEATRWFWYADGVPVAAAVVPIQDGEPISDPPFSAHQGIAISAEVMKLPTHRRFSRVLEIVDSLLNALSKQNERLHFSFHPYFDDLRGVLWFNYHALEKGRFEISLKYTARLCIHPEDTREAWISASSHGRKYDYNKSER
jgi:hypothetical protein